MFYTGNTIFRKTWFNKLYYCFRLKFGPRTNLNIQNLMIMLIVSALHQKCHFWANLVNTIKIILGWTLVLRLIWIYINQWWWSFFFLLYTGNTVFRPKKWKLLFLSWNLVLRLIWICRLQWWCSFFLL